MSVRSSARSARSSVPAQSPPSMPTKQSQPTSPPPNSDSGQWFIIDTKYPTVGAVHVVVSCDKVAFGVSDFALRHSNTLWQLANEADTSAPVFYLDDPSETGDALRLLLDVLGGQRLAHWDDDAWPSPPLLLASLQLARKYEFTVAYDLIIAYAQLLVDRRNRSRHLCGMFRVAAILDDEILATLCIARISEDHGADTDVASWSPETVVGIPTAYLWAFIRSVRNRWALGANGINGMDGNGIALDTSVEHTFRASLQAIKALEKCQVSP